MKEGPGVGKTRALILLDYNVGPQNRLNVFFSAHPPNSEGGIEISEVQHYRALRLGRELGLNKK